MISLFLLLQCALLSCGFRFNPNVYRSSNRPLLQMNLQNTKNGNIMTLSRFMIEATRNNPGTFLLIILFC